MIPEDTADVIVRCQRDRTVHVRLCDRFREDQDCLHYAVEASAPGLNARVDAVAAWNWDADLAPFLDELAADFRGWRGERVWQTADRDLAVRAIFHSGGHVAVSWTLCPWRNPTDGWKATVTTWLEAGEQMSILAADVRDFLHHEPETT
ncbi:hypothetical protein BIV57_00870 [Mangrovactinospora gilvigrisea]|uniref:Uncharacterized protein n=1 Tax=Mangrovactinospora gilvigrisea TaxID=1428644 RepID=A0A1J7C117_9ACTN|nr:DUF6228 family protein [Mangrovactinospora gilvigrisea]OIV39425.1 hypothetical protein BIV57_00870 [Mangrovactinospora gilvigrisea]